MGFDISYHPISPEQLKSWYFDRLPEVVQKDFSQIKKIGKESGVDELYIDKYIETMKVAATTGPQDSFEKTHAYYIAVIQGFFQSYFYTRGTALSFLINLRPAVKKYITSWNEVKPESILCPVIDRLSENYSGGIYMGAEQVSDLLAEFKQGGEVKELFLSFFEGNFSVFVKALEYASEHGMGLLEASEVIEPNPLDLNKSTSYSNLFNCDPEGALNYQNVAMEQLESAIRKSKEKESKY